jgi:hypothetical protein
MRAGGLREKTEQEKGSVLESRQTKLLRVTTCDLANDIGNAVLQGMNWDAISAVGQIVGAFGVIVSVIYLAQQVRSNARQPAWHPCGRCRRHSMSGSTDWQVIPRSADLYHRGMRDFEVIEGADLPRFSVLMDSLFRIYEDMYFQQLERSSRPASLVRL